MEKAPHNHGGLFEKCPEKLPQDADFAVAADIFRQLDDSTRLKLFWILCHCEECVVNLSAMLGMSSPAVSHHLRLLRSADLVVTRRDGREVYYRAADTPTCQCLHLAIEKIMQINCPERLVRDGAAFPVAGARLIAPAHGIDDTV